MLQADGGAAEEHEAPAVQQEYWHLPQCNSSRQVPPGPGRSCLCYNLMEDGKRYRALRRDKKAV